MPVHDPTNLFQDAITKLVKRLAELKAKGMEVEGDYVQKYVTCNLVFTVES